MSCDFYVFGLVDGQGERIQAICTKEDETIIIDGHFNDGREFAFEAKARHLHDWAVQNDLKPFKYGYNLADCTVSVVYHDHPQGVTKTDQDKVIEANRKKALQRSSVGGPLTPCENCGSVVFNFYTEQSELECARCFMKHEPDGRVRLINVIEHRLEDEEGCPIENMPIVDKRNADGEAICPECSSDNVHMTCECGHMWQLPAVVKGGTCTECSSRDIVMYRECDTNEYVMVCECGHEWGPIDMEFFDGMTQAIKDHVPPFSVPDNIGIIGDPVSGNGDLFVPAKFANCESLTGPAVIAEWPIPERPMDPVLEELAILRAKADNLTARNDDLEAAVTNLGERLDRLAKKVFPGNPVPRPYDLGDRRRPV